MLNTPQTNEIFLITFDHVAFIGIDSLTTVAELEHKVASQLGLRDASLYALFEITETDERILDKKQRVMENISMWRRQYWVSKEATEGI